MEVSLVPPPRSGRDARGRWLLVSASDARSRVGVLRESNSRHRVRGTSTSGRSDRIKSGPKTRWAPDPTPRIACAHEEPPSLLLARARGGWDAQEPLRRNARTRKSRRITVVLLTA